MLMEIVEIRDIGFVNQEERETIITAYDEQGEEKVVESTTTTDDPFIRFALDVRNVQRAFGGKFWHAAKEWESCLEEQAKRRLSKENLDRYNQES